MTPAEFYASILEPSLANFPGQLDTPEANVLLLAIAGQETSWTNRVQQDGPARGFWQSEKGGMLDGVMNGPYAYVLDKMLAVYSVPNDIDQIFEAIAWHDPIACLVARLGLFMDPNKLPAVGDQAGAWDYYQRNWNPGKPSLSRWGTVYPQAVKVIQP